MEVNELKWFKRKGSTLSSSLNIEIKPGDKGLSINVFRDENKLEIPFQLSALDFKNLNFPDTLHLLEELWYDELLVEESEGYFLPYEVIYQLEPKERGHLQVPEETTIVDLKLENTGFVGSKNFEIVPRYSTTKWGQLDLIGSRKGPVIILPNEEKLLRPNNQFQFLETINESIEKRNQDDLFPYIARVKKMAKEMNIPLSNHLERENYHFIEDMDITLGNSDSHITVSPVLKDDSLPFETLQSMNQKSAGYMKSDNGERIFVDHKVRENAKVISEMQAIEGQDIPKFVQNPEAYLPEGLSISLEQFGERVRELGIRVYRAQPYVHAQNSERGWFQLDTGFNIQDEDGETEETLSVSELEDKINQAKENGEDYIQWEGKWIHVPHEGKEFAEASQKAKELMQQQGTDFTSLPYVLEIFENFSNLEYNAPILEEIQKFEDLGVFEKIPPASFKALLKPFQEDGFVWMKSLHVRKIGGLLADDMGLGKTIQVIAFLSYLESINESTPSLIVVPKTLMDNWQKELNKFAPILGARVYLHSGSSRVKAKEFLEDSSIVITTYQTLVRDQLLLGQVNWKVVICDEAQAIKNPTTSVSKVLKALKANFRLAMTGTPVENGLSELWSIMDFVQPGMLGSLKEFKEDYIKPLQSNVESAEEIEKRITGKLRFSYKRRTKQGELKDQLPEKRKSSLSVPMGKKQQQLYEDTLTLVQNKIKKPLQAIMELKQISSHPGLVFPEYRSMPLKDVPKLEKTIEIIREIKNKQEKVLIFTEYKVMQMILREHILNEFGIHAPIINGETPRRQLEVDRFNDSSNFNVMILSPKAAGTGLTITSANHVIHYTRWWNPAVENQATDRVYRIGQTKDVYVHYPIVENKVELTVNKILSEKENLANNIIVPSNSIDIEKEILNGVVYH
jgi:superfamily II DNA or RNA helicase